MSVHAPEESVSHVLWKGRAGWTRFSLRVRDCITQVAFTTHAVRSLPQKTVEKKLSDEVQTIPYFFQFPEKARAERRCGGYPLHASLSVLSLKEREICTPKCISSSLLPSDTRGITYRRTFPFSVPHPVTHVYSCPFEHKDSRSLTNFRLVGTGDGIQFGPEI